MLLEFRVSNYRSIMDEQVFCLLPLSKDKTLDADNIHHTGNESIPSVLRGAGIYGANASGKSNLIKSMIIMQAIVRDSATVVQAGQTLNVQSFALDKEHPSKPSSFEVTILINNIRFQYGFSLTSKHIIEEWLLVYKSSKPQEWFTRSRNIADNKDEYHFSSHFIGNKEIWRQATRDNALFLSAAVQLNNEQLKPLWYWITTQWLIIPANVPLIIDHTLNHIGRVESKEKIIEFLNSADIGIANIEVQNQKQRHVNVFVENATGRVMPGEPVDRDVPLALLTHVGSAGTATFSLADESQGTQRLFAFAGIILNVLQSGATLVVDEMENSMHPLMVRHLLKLFFSSQSNPRGAQIIFSTHNTSFLDNSLLRRDQIWFTEKGSDLATSLVPMSEFSPRKKEAFEKNYLEGRYGAIPILMEFDGIGGSV
jgi:hypothetical protein